MRALYVDNFRGFRDTLIPIADVNFLVGENSTGKTSILSILRLFSDMTFWAHQDFNVEDVKLGSFADITSGVRAGSKSFRIGLVKDEGATSDIVAILIEFGEEHGVPIAMRYSCYFKGFEVHVKFLKKEMKVLTRNISYSNYEEIIQAFHLWKYGNIRREEFTFSKLRIPSRDQFALFGSMMMIEHELLAKKEESTRLTSFVQPFIADRMTWIAPVRSKPKRTYDELLTKSVAEGDHAPYVLRKLLRDKSHAREFRSYLEQYGSDSGLYDSLEIQDYGSLDNSPFAILIGRFEKKFTVSNVGYGVSQILPIIVDIFTRGRWFAIQQPEIHLHPRAQAALGELIFKFANFHKKRFMIETHSDYIIDRFRLQFAEQRINMSSQALFFSSAKGGNRIQVIPILKNGRYDPKQPKKFRDFFVLEELGLLRLR